ncbi:Fic family protein [bacterium]|nr:Fic family protein [bacterium]
MFKPNFSYTHNIVNNLVEITSARELILNAYLVPKWEISLRREALIRAAHASTAIEGNPLTLEEVSQLARGRKVVAARRAKQEVLNYLNVLEHIEKYQENGIVKEEHILNLHKDITKETLENPEWEGKYRKIQVYVGNRITGEIIFIPPPPEEVPSLMKNFIKWLNSEEALKLHPVLVAGISHYELVRIHPFVDGNGRTARVIATLILYIREFDIKRFFALDDYYDSDRRAYYSALKSVNQKTLDLTQWLEYFTEGIKVSILRVKEKVLQLSIEGKRRKEKGQIALTERQMKIIEFIQKNGRITAGNVANMFKITRQAALKELSKLVELDVITLRGKGRGAHYVLV